MTTREGFPEGAAAFAATDRDELTRARLAALVTSCPDPIIGETLDGIITDWNPAAERLYGYIAAEAVGQPISLIAPPDRADEVAVLLDRVRRGESIENFETVRRARDGRLIDVSLTIFPIRNDAGVLIGASATTRDITALKRAGTELAVARQQTHDLLERISDGFIALDQDWRLTIINDAAERILQQPRDALLGQSIWQALPPAVHTPFYAACHDVLAAGQPASLEFFYPPYETWFDVRLEPNPPGLVVFLRDVTGTHQLTQELRTSEARYRALVEQMPGVVYLQAADEQETLLYFSSYLEELTGFMPEEALQQAGEMSWLEFVHPEDRERIARQNDSAEDDGRHFRAEYRILRADGTSVWVRDDSVPVYDEHGAIIAWQGVLLDISDRIEAEEAQARLAAIVAGADDAIISSTRDGTITSWNHGAEQLFGYPAAAMIGQSLQKLVPRGETLAIPLLPDDAGVASVRYEARRRRADGAIIDVAISRSPIRDRNDDMVGVSSIMRDITERRRAEDAVRVALEEAQAATQAKSRFLAILSHELRTPLQAVLGYADFLLHDPQAELSTEQREDIGYIHRGATRMVTLIEQMLDLSRMEAGRLELAITDVDLAEVIEQVREDVAPQAEAKGLALEIDLAPDLPLARGDSGRLRQILLNLAGNAVKFTEQGSVRISAVAAPDGEGIDVAVSDSGIGIPQDALERIFDEFQQVDSAQARRHGGAGLGLSIARGLAEQMGGQITVTSEPGTGSTFVLRVMGDRSRRQDGKERVVSRESCAADS